MEENKAFESFSESITSLLKVLDEETSECNKKSTFQEILLPPPETLLVQYAHRTIFSSADACDEHLTTQYWLAIPADEGETDLENVSLNSSNVSLVQTYILGHMRSCRFVSTNFTT